jgi:hypothetical protein
LGGSAGNAITISKIIILYYSPALHTFVGD